MICSCCEADCAQTLSLTDTIEVLGHAFQLAVHVVHCPACGYVESAETRGDDLHRGVARELARGGVRSAEAFDYVARVVGLGDAELATALGVGAHALRRWRAGVDDVPAGVMSKLGLLLGQEEDAG